jgi:hypothetical protein
METWLSEHRPARAFDQLMIRVRTSKGSMEMQRLPVQPDGTFELHHGQGATRIFLEVDRGTRRVDTWAEKMAAYQAYLGSPELRDRSGVESFLLLVVASDEAQCQRLMETTARVVRGPMPHIYFTLASNVHLLTIGGGPGRDRGTACPPDGCRGPILRPSDYPDSTAHSLEVIRHLGVTELGIHPGEGCDHRWPKGRIMGEEGMGYGSQSKKSVAGGGAAPGDANASPDRRNVPHLE